MLAPVAAHLFTTRRWRLGFPAADAEPGWGEVAEAIGVAAGALVRVRQVHGNAVFVATGNGDGRPSVPAASPPPADIIIGREGQMALAVQTADCVPVLMADAATGAVAAVHAGWRWLAAGAPREAVHALQAKYGVRPRDLVAAIGPAIGACCYQVGPDVREAFQHGGFTPEQITAWFSTMPRSLANNPPIASVPLQPQPDRWFFDGWAAARAQLESAGVPASQIFTARLCTASHAGLFCSYRRDGSTGGRMVAAVKSIARVDSPKSIVRSR